MKSLNTASTAKLDNSAESKGVTPVVNGILFSVVRINTPEAAKAMAEGTSVSLKDMRHFGMYNEQGTVYAIRDGAERFFAHPDVGVMDERDMPISVSRAERIFERIANDVLEQEVDLGAVFDRAIHGIRRAAPAQSPVDQSAKKSGLQFSF